MSDTNLFYIGIRFLGNDKTYFFSTTFDDLKENDLVVVETVTGLEMGTISTPLNKIETYKGTLELKPILRKPTKDDMIDYNFNLEQGKKALAITKREVAELGLAMDLIDAIYTLDGSKVTITYTSSEKRVDFRELLKKLVRLIPARIELKQIASRDKARMVGGIGICGLPLCCSTYLSQFEAISIAKAKNQMLTLNIPKLSGPCGKLICCLSYEDETYTIEKKDFPHLGTKIHLDEGDYFVDSINIISRTVRLTNQAKDDYRTFPLEDIKAMINGTYKKKEISLEKEYKLPDFNISSTNTKENSYMGVHPDKLDKGKYGSSESNNQKNKNNRNARSNEQNNNRNGQQRQNSNNRNHFRHKPKSNKFKDKQNGQKV